MDIVVVATFLDGRLKRLYLESSWFRIAGFQDLANHLNSERTTTVNSHGHPIRVQGLTGKLAMGQDPMPTRPPHHVGISHHDMLRSRLSIWSSNLDTLFVTLAAVYVASSWVQDFDETQDKRQRGPGCGRKKA